MIDIQNVLPDYMDEFEEVELPTGWRLVKADGEYHFSRDFKYDCTVFEAHMKIEKEEDEWILHMDNMMSILSGRHGSVEREQNISEAYRKIKDRMQYLNEKVEDSWDREWVDD